MNEFEFKLQLHTKLCEIADLVLLHYNPCVAMRGACIVSNPVNCCVRTRFKKFDADQRCPFLAEGCTFPNIHCKVWLCKTAYERTSPECRKILQTLGDMAKDYELMS